MEGLQLRWIRQQNNQASAATNSSLARDLAAMPNPEKIFTCLAIEPARSYALHHAMPQFKPELPRPILRSQIVISKICYVEQIIGPASPRQ
jgi:hypothetical protein